MLRMASDPVPNIRFNVSKTLEKMAPRLEVCQGRCICTYLKGYTKSAALPPLPSYAHLFVCSRCSALLCSTISLNMPTPDALLLFFDDLSFLLDWPLLPSPPSRAE